MARFAEISHRLDKLALWCFPLGFHFSNGKIKKKPLVKWLDLQTRPPLAHERAYWRSRFSWASAAIPTGPATDLLVVDADSPEAIDYLASQGMPTTWLVKSRRGLHAYFRWPQVGAHDSASIIAKGVDICASRPVVAPGSAYYYREGNRWELFEYRWIAGRSPADCPRAEAPEWLVAWLKQRAEQAALRPVIDPHPYRGVIKAWTAHALEGMRADLAAAEPGTRNDTANRVAFRAGQLHAAGELSTEVLWVICAITDQWPEPAKTRDTVMRGFAAGQKSPSGPRRAA